MPIHLRKLLINGFLAALLLTSNGCTSIQLVSNYDETIDSQALALQKKFDTYFVSFSSSGNDKRDYRSQRSFYEEALVDLNSIQVRADGIYKNKLTSEQISLARENLAYLVLLHKGCIKSPLSGEQKKQVRENGVDLSMDCKKQNGADVDVEGRGDQKLNPFLVAPLQSLFNQHFGTIMALELAKKRGESNAGGN